MHLPRKKLPISIQTLSELILGGHYYVDKTGYALNMIERGKYYFLSRPRHFGKSLFIDTLKEIFEANEVLFRGLAIHNKWNWAQAYPVIRISFCDVVLQSPHDLSELLGRQLESHERKFSLPARYPDCRSRLCDLIKRLHRQGGQKVVILVDEYDKPILDLIENPAMALLMRDALKDIYCAIKDCDAHICFAMLAGISRCGKISLSNSVDKLIDITLAPRYSSLCGFTEVEIDTVFGPELQGLDRDDMRCWYCGYNWRGNIVYNPLDLLMLFDRREFRPWSFEAGTPAFLSKLAAADSFFTTDLAQLRAGEELAATFDGCHTTPESLLFQTGHLTLHKAEQSPAGNWKYTLKYPNRQAEVSLALLAKPEFRSANNTVSSVDIANLPRIVGHGGI